MSVANEPNQNSSVWLALRNRVFLGLWLASVVSGVCVSAHDTAATWLMSASGASSLRYHSFFSSYLPELLADLSNRRNHFIATYLLLASAAGLLALFAWLHLAHPYVILGIESFASALR
jgi:Transmembrane secretion effector